VANIFYIGGASTTRKTYTFVVSGAAPTASGNSVFTINSKTVTVVAAASGETIATLLPRLLAAVQSSNVPGEFKLGTWGSTATSITFIGPTDGRDVTVSLTVAGSTVTTTSNTASSPYDLANTANWQGGVLPGNSDVAVFDRDTPVRYGLSALSAVTCEIRRTPGHRSDISLPDVHANGFAEYLPTKLLCSGATWNITDSGIGAVRLSVNVPTGLTFNAAGGNKILTSISSTAGLVAGMAVSGTGIDPGSTIASVDSSTQITLTSTSNVTAGTGVAITFLRAVAVNITGSGTSTSNATRIEATGASATWTVALIGGSLTILSGTTAAITAANAVLSIPYLLPVTTFVANGTLAQVAVTVSTSFDATNGSDVEFLAGSSLTSGEPLRIHSSTVRWSSTGNSGVHTLGLDATFNSSTAPGAYAIESSTVSKGASYIDPYERATKPFVITFDSCTPDDVTLQLGNVTSLEVA